LIVFDFYRIFAQSSIDNISFLQSPVRGFIVFGMLKKVKMFLGQGLPSGEIDFEISSLSLLSVYGFDIISLLFVKIGNNTQKGIMMRAIECVTEISPDGYFSLPSEVIQEYGF